MLPIGRVIVMVATIVWIVAWLTPGLAATQTPQLHDDADRAPFLNDYIGRYELTPTFVLNVTRVGDALYLEAPNQDPAQLRPRSETEFVLVGSGLRVIFGFDPITETVNHLIFEQAGIGRRARKLEDGATPVETRRVVDLAPETLERYVGTYEEQPGFAITITLENGRLAAGMEGLPTEAILPESETEFFYERTSASLSFEIGTNGQVDRLILHQGGSDLAMDRRD